MQMAQNPNFWDEYPIYLNANTLLTEKEKQLLKQHKLQTKGDPHQYHPFLESSIKRAQLLNQSLKPPVPLPGTKDEQAQVEILTTVPPP